MKTSLSLEQFRAAFQAGGFQAVAVRAEGVEFHVTAKPQTGKRVTLGTTHGKKVRAFRDAGKAIALLHAMGAREVKIDTTLWSPEKAKLGRARPDTSERQKRAHAAADHDAWFRSEVEKSLKEADSPGAVWISQDEMKRRSVKKRAEWLKKA